MRNLDKIIFHCADTRIDQSFSVETVRKWHTDPKPKGRGWSDIGYHYYIDLKGTLHKGRPIEKKGAHCKGYNKGSVGVCFEGGKKADGSKWDKPKPTQLETARVLIGYLRATYNDNLTIHGHYEFSSKSCPNFDVCIIEDYT
jgi:N-acetylmuramoyl-L-alanine amidase